MSRKKPYTSAAYRKKSNKIRARNGGKNGQAQDMFFYIVFVVFMFLCAIGLIK